MKAKKNNHNKIRFIGMSKSDIKIDDTLVTKLVNCMNRVAKKRAKSKSGDKDKKKSKAIGVRG